MGDYSDFPAGAEPVADLSCQALADSLAAYAWGALEPDQRAVVEHHRLHCPACDRWLRESERALSRVELAVPRAAPPPALRSRVLASIDATPRAVAPVRPAAAAVPDSHLGRPRPTPTVARTVGHAGAAQRRARWRASPFLAGLGTGLVGALAAAMLVVVLIVRPQALSALAPSQSQFGASDSGQPAPASFLPGGPGQSSTRLLELRSSSTSGRGLLAYDSDTRRGVLLLEGLTSADGTEYSVWLVQGQQREALGSTVTDARGVATFVLPEPLPLGHPERIEIGPANGTGAVLSANF